MKKAVRIIENAVNILAMCALGIFVVVLILGCVLACFGINLFPESPAPGAAFVIYTIITTAILLVVNFVFFILNIIFRIKVKLWKYNVAALAITGACAVAVIVAIWLIQIILPPPWQ